ncbi:MAG: hypothetical protein R3193_18330 [Marinobacter sp.]|nr:hypothetical protein [Marinobacter sp.]
MINSGWAPVSVNPMELPGKRAKLTLTPHFINPVALAQAISGEETQSVVLSEETSVLSAWTITIEPQSAIAASA